MQKIKLSIQSLYFEKMIINYHCAWDLGGAGDNAGSGRGWLQSCAWDLGARG